MKIVLAVDGSKYSKKAVAYVLANDQQLLAGDGEILLLNVQAAVHNRVSKLVGAAAVKEYHKEEAEKVLSPICKILERHGVKFKSQWSIGQPAKEIVAASNKFKAHMIVMGTHGHGMLGQALIGSVAQRVLGDAQVPLLLVK